MSSKADRMNTGSEDESENEHTIHEQQRRRQTLWSGDRGKFTAVDRIKLSVTWFDE